MLWWWGWCWGKRNWKIWQLRMGRVGLGVARFKGGGHRSNSTTVAPLVDGGALHKFDFTNKFQPLLYYTTATATTKCNHETLAGGCSWCNWQSIVQLDITLPLCILQCIWANKSCKTSSIGSCLPSKLCKLVMMFFRIILHNRHFKTRFLAALMAAFYLPLVDSHWLLL